MEEDPIRNDARRVRSKRKPVQLRLCPMCRCLRPANAFQAHHTNGRSNSPNVTLDVCVWCHRKQHLMLLEGGVSLTVPETAPERVIAVLKAQAVFSQSNADSFWE